MRQTGRLTLRIEYEDDSGIELAASAASGAFSGASAAWFSRQKLIEFANRLGSTYPIPAGECIEIRGGYAGPRDEDDNEIHLLVALRPINHRGTVGCEIELSSDRFGGGNQSFQQRCHMELWTTYEEIRRFADELSQLLAGTRKDANLDETEH